MKRILFLFLAFPLFCQAVPVRYLFVVDTSFNGPGEADFEPCSFGYHFARLRRSNAKWRGIHNLDLQRTSLH